MRLRLFIATLAMLVAPLLAADAVGYYATGYTATGFSGMNVPVKPDSSSTQSPSTQSPSAQESSVQESSESLPQLSESSSAGHDDAEKIWAASIAFALPFYTNSDFYGYGEGFAFDLSLKRFVSTPVRNLSVPVEVEISFAWYEGEFDSYKYDDWYSWFTLDLYNNILARYTFFSVFYVEAGIEWGFNIITEPGEDIYEPSFFRLGLPIGFGLRVANIIECGERVVFTTDDYIRYEILSFAILF